ncbi:MAG: trypsin-like peptidase domain-containing protein [Ruminococcus sp.]|nr:trypsin-like peptidase domain-containing protein [Ruminococcus sp.]
MENQIPTDGFRPEDEYPDLSAQPIEAEEPVAPYRPDDDDDIPVIDPPKQNDPATAPSAQEMPQEAPYPTYPQGMPYPTYPQYPGYPQPPYPQQPQYPQGVSYPQYPPYPGYPQQPYQQYPAQPPYQPQPQNPQGAYQPYPQQRPYPPQTNAPQAQPTQPAQPAQSSDPSVIVPDRKQPMSTGTKVFIIILIALLIAMITGFIVYVANASKNTAKNNDPFGIGTDGNGNFDILDNVEDEDLELKEYTDEITLVTDDGATQKRENDNPDSVGKPDKDAKSIEINDLPKDSDDDKYTAKSSFNELVDSVVTISCYKDKITENVYDIVSSGSGTIISSDGYIVTNAHVLGNSKQFAVNVTLNSGKKYQAKIVGYDTWTDLAVLKVDAKDLKPAAFGDSDKIEVGDNVIAIGSPGGMKYQNSLTQGVISAVDREINVNKYVRFIQSDAAINPGSSGGPLCNLCGQVIGITSAKTVAENYESMSFSIPSQLVKEIVADLVHYGYVRDRARIGFSGREVSADEKLYYGLPSGVIVQTISDDGALKGTDVKEYDVITAVDGTQVASFQDIYNVLAKHKSGDKVEITFTRIENDDPKELLDYPE